MEYAWNGQVHELTKRIYKNTVARSNPVYTRRIFNTIEVIFVLHISSGQTETILAQSEPLVTVCVRQLGALFHDLVFVVPRHLVG